MFSYAPPHILGVEGNAQTAGGEKLTIKGTDIGDGKMLIDDKIVYAGKSQVVQTVSGSFKLNTNVYPSSSRDRCTVGNLLYHHSKSGSSNDDVRMFIKRVGSWTAHSFSQTSYEVEPDLCYQESRWIELGCYSTSVNFPQSSTPLDYFQTTSESKF